MTDNTKRAKSAPKKPVVHDQQGIEYELRDKLGEGGQGVVCTTDRDNVLIKLFTGRDAEQRRHWVNRLNWVLNQELDGLHIARPRALIERPYPGYVMELMDGLESLQASLDSSRAALLEGAGLSGYLATGGLRRRLALLRELATTLAGLHARGLAYVDLSPANVFVSKSIEHCQVWLIDCDNLCATERLGHGHLYTPDYGAPEVVRGERGVNSLTDAWSFAVLAFEMLTHGHPLKGEAVLDADPDEEARALRGELPWVHHPADTSNQACEGLPMELVATPRLQVLFENCFNAGRDNPLARPSLAAWADALEAAWALMLDCTTPDCGSSFYWNEERQCPFCDQVAADGLLLAHAWYSDASPDEPHLDTGDRLALALERPVALHLAPVGMHGYSEAPLVCEVRLDKAGLHLTPKGEGELTLVRIEDGKTFPITQPQTLSAKADRRRGSAAGLLLAHPDEPRLRPFWRFTW
ncbi:protein kinase [Thiorhodococcus mannitoliphagus]|uniref:Protein kinase n=1 Tax=Thiorhodococcus mannitoliphagus TaxID=329406 RepID=A0A6P1DW22_9GAMM|nr:protein kinase [Thiorhodococcus mannitoliphagus]NEX21211.1 protein kinase [Thiorhodococcus mannitoliphagus]